jgi:hypothetical protein
MQQVEKNFNIMMDLLKALLGSSCVNTLAAMNKQQ